MNLPLKWHEVHHPICLLEVEYSSILHLSLLWSYSLPEAGSNFKGSLLLFFFFFLYWLMLWKIFSPKLQNSLAFHKLIKTRLFCWSFMWTGFLKRDCQGLLAATLCTFCEALCLIWKWILYKSSWSHSVTLIKRRVRTENAFLFHIL